VIVFETYEGSDGDDGEEDAHVSGGDLATGA
jgi:hypothetical protein